MWELGGVGRVGEISKWQPFAAAKSEFVILGRAQRRRLGDRQPENFASRDRRAEVGDNSIVTTVVSALLVVGLPAAFWISVLELANYVLAIALAPATRMAIAAVLIGLLSLIWSFILVAARSGKAKALKHR